MAYAVGDVGEEAKDGGQEAERDGDAVCYEHIERSVIVDVYRECCRYVRRG